MIVATRDTFPLFVYGLLLPGEPMWSDLEPHVAESESATIRGELYWNAGGAYPLLVAGADVADPEARVRGRRMLVRPSTEVSDLLVRGEVLVGYDARWLVTEPDAQPALAFCWPWGATNRGARIDSGDRLAREL